MPGVTKLSHRPYGKRRPAALTQWCAVISPIIATGSATRWNPKSPGTPARAFAYSTGPLATRRCVKLGLTLALADNRHHLLPAQLGHESRVRQ